MQRWWKLSIGNETDGGRVDVSVRVNAGLDDQLLEHGDGCN
jgi:hypothetical protein